MFSIYSVGFLHIFNVYPCKTLYADPASHCLNTDSSIPQVGSIGITKHTGKFSDILGTKKRVINLVYNFIFVICEKMKSLSVVILEMYIYDYHNESQTAGK